MGRRGRRASHGAEARAPHRYAIRDRLDAIARRRDTRRPIVNRSLCRGVEMCRSIHPLHNYEPPATTDEIGAAALQFVRKISGMTRPSQANEAAFERAVEAVTAASERLLGELVTAAPPRDRALDRERARVRWERRQARA